MSFLNGFYGEIWFFPAYRRVQMILQIMYDDNFRYFIRLYIFYNIFNIFQKKISIFFILYILYLFIYFGHIFHFYTGLLTLAVVLQNKGGKSSS